MIIVIEGPSGAGKDSTINELIKQQPKKFEKIISLSTRNMREYEKQGNPYYFVSDAEFDGMVKTGDIFEWTNIHGTKRGMSEKYIRQILNKNKIALKDCNLIGVRALQKKFGEKNVLSIFLLATKEMTESRLRKRGDSEKEITHRLAEYDEHIKEAEYYDYTTDGNLTVKETVDNILEIIYNAFYYGKK
jgi:guanylate kinase